MTGELFHIRAAQADDLSTLCAFAAGEGMDAIPSIEGVSVAESQVGDVVGFVRIVEGTGADGKRVAHVNPIVVYPTWRGLGVGRALVEDALERHGELRLVARGSSMAFYQALGFTSVPWETIEPSIVAECNGCEMYEECAPIPMACTAD